MRLEGGCGQGFRAGQIAARDARGRLVRCGTCFQVSAGSGACACT